MLLNYLLADDRTIRPLDGPLVRTSVPANTTAPELPFVGMKRRFIFPRYEPNGKKDIFQNVVQAYLAQLNS